MFTKEKLEMTLKENAGKMAEETDQPGNEYIRKSLVSMTTRRIIKWSSFCFVFFLEIWFSVPMKESMQVILCMMSTGTINRK